MHRAALYLDPRPALLNRGSQPFVPIEDHQARPLQSTLDQPLDEPTPALSGLALQKLQVQHHLLPIRFDSQTYQHRRRHHLVGDPYPQRNTIQIKKYHRLCFQRPLAPIGKQGLKTPHNPRYRTLGKRCTTQKRRERSPNAPPVRSAEVTSQQSTVHRSSAPLITLNEPALPFLFLSTLAQPCPRQLNGRRSQSSADPSFSLAVAIPAPLALALIGQCRQYLAQLCFGQSQNHLSNLPSQRFSQPIWP